MLAALKLFLKITIEYVAFHSRSFACNAERQRESKSYDLYRLNSGIRTTFLLGMVCVH